MPIIDTSFLIILYELLHVRAILTSLQLPLQTSDLLVLVFEINAWLRQHKLIRCRDSDDKRPPIQLGVVDVFTRTIVDVNALVVTAITG